MSHHTDELVPGMHDDHGHDHHDHDHNHDHGGWFGRLTAVVRPHSHDSTESVDSALESSAQGIRAVKVSLVALAVTGVLQLVVALASSSVGLLADTVHNMSDALTALPLWIAFVVGRRPADRRYTYGYGRAEDLAGLFIVAMIALSAVIAGVEAIRRLVHPAPVAHLGWVAVAGLIGFAGNELVAVYRIRVGRRIGSAALEADGVHARTDGITSLAVLVGAGGVALGFPLADPIVGLLITVTILAVLRTTVRDVYRRLMDAVDPALVDRAETALLATPGITGVRGVRMRWIGHSLHAEADLDIDGSVSVTEAHRLAHDAEERLITGVPRLRSAAIHAYPTQGDDAPSH
ncbi:MAG: cation diffusion facilitator family transporter [Blastococcus sp.]